MVDENRVKLMTRLAIYEKHEGNRNLVMSKYYKKDYVRYHVLKTWVASTVVYWTVIGSYIFMKFEELLAGINDIDYFDIMYRMLGWYVVFCAVYFFFTTIIYNYRYAKAKPGLVEYNSNLKDLIELEGGAMHHAKVVDKEDTMLQGTNETAEAEDSSALKAKGNVSRSAIVNQRLAEEEKRREEEILENVKRRNARLAEKERQARQLEEDRRRIQERRRLLERQEMERRRRMRQEQIERERFTAYGNSDEEGSDS